MLTIPPRPPVAAPEPRYRAPLFPLLADPELNTSRPLTPFVPAFALRIEITPLLVAVPSPLSKLSAPPVFTLLRPDSTLTPPPDPLVPLPTLMLTMPPRPPVATPDPRYSAPLLPVTADPELNTSRPLTPASPAFAVRTE
ncbi:MAG: hypothetical protein VXZ35_08475, partial [Pseudomonadota bacterium]|nr:hypothetical protein [Pseudomonadota bacterium]